MSTTVPTQTNPSLDHAYRELIAELCDQTPYWQEAGDAYRTHVRECAEAAVNEAIVCFGPEPYLEWREGVGPR